MKKKIKNYLEFFLSKLCKGKIFSFCIIVFLFWINKKRPIFERHLFLNHLYFSQIINKNDYEKIEFLLKTFQIILKNSFIELLFCFSIYNKKNSLFIDLFKGNKDPRLRYYSLITQVCADDANDINVFEQSRLLSKSVLDKNKSVNLNALDTLPHMKNGKIKILYQCSFLGTANYDHIIKNILKYHDINKFEIFYLDEGLSLNDKNFLSSIGIYYVSFSEVKSMFFDFILDLDGFMSGKYELYKMHGKLCGRYISLLNDFLNFGGPKRKIIYYEYFRNKNNHENKLFIENSACLSLMNESILPSPRSLPFFSKGFMSFGTAMDSYKVSYADISTWSKILSHVKGSRFVFVNGFFKNKQFRDKILIDFKKIWCPRR